MTISKLLDKFYLDNGIPPNGGIEEDTFKMKVFFINFTLPNPKFRKKLTYIHDIQHILNNCDTSWKGEAFISGWEIGTGLWKRFPINLFIFWAFGYSLWIYPKSVYKGFKKGINSIGIIDLGFNKSEFMEMELDELIRITEKEKNIKIGIWQWLQFSLWIFISQVILLFPFVLILLGFIWSIGR